MILLRHLLNDTVVTLIVHRVRSKQVGETLNTIATREKEEPNRVGLGAITEDLKHRVRTGLVRFIGLASVRISHEHATVVPALRERRTRSLTIGEEHGVNNLKAVVLAELGDDLHRGENRLVKRSARQTEITGHRVVRRIRRIVHHRNGEQGRHRFLELIRAHLGGQEVEQSEPVETGNLLRSLRTIDPIVLGIVDIHILVRLLTRQTHRAESVDFKRNVAAAAEQSDLHQLLDGIHERTRHRTRPVDEHDKTVVLTLTDSRVAAEDVLADAVVHHANGVKDTSTRHRGTLRSIGRLAEVELLRHERDHRRGLSGELGVLLSSTNHKCLMGRRGATVVRGLDSIAVLPVLNDLANLRIGADDVVEIGGSRKHIVIVPTIGSVRHLLHRVVELLLRRRRRRESFVLVLLCGTISRAARLTVTGRRIVLVLATLITGGRRVTVALLTIVTLTLARLTILTLLVGVVRVTLHRSRLTLLVGVTVAAGATLRVLLLRLFLQARLVLPQIRDDLRHLIEGAAVVDARDERLLNGRKVDTRSGAGAHLVVKIDAVDEGQRVHVASLDTEEVGADELLIRLEEVAAHTGELLLHQLLDAGVFHDIHVPLSDVSVSGTGDALRATAPRTRSLLIVGSVRSKQRVTDLVTHEHIVNLIAHTGPGGKREDTIANIEHGGTRLGIVLHGNVFRGENTRQKILAGGVNGARGSGRGSE